MTTLPEPDDEARELTDEELAAINEIEDDDGPLEGEDDDAR